MTLGPLTGLGEPVHGGLRTRPRVEHRGRLGADIRALGRVG
jgi:hypothetical protein